MHEGSGSVVSHIRVGDCSKFEINIPPLEIQRSIVEILKSLDDHIDVNIKINQTWNKCPKLCSSPGLWISTR
ncbi:TPA: hypothetical protein MIH06_26305 [Klebsiella pneumoniae]|nr:hypothetical protein [Klebsiella pneumoniae]HBX7993864.1 hypothetical protein [Klebsiella pneumoniae]